MKMKENVLIPSLASYDSCEWEHLPNAFRSSPASVSHLSSLDGVFHGHRPATFRMHRVRPLHRNRTDSTSTETSPALISGDVAFSFLPMPFKHSVTISVRIVKSRGSTVTGDEGPALFEDSSFLDNNHALAFNVTISNSLSATDTPPLGQEWAGHLHAHFHNASSSDFCSSKRHVVASVPRGRAGKFVGMIVYANAHGDHTEVRRAPRYMMGTCASMPRAATAHALMHVPAVPIQTCLSAGQPLYRVGCLASLTGLLSRHRVGGRPQFAMGRLQAGNEPVEAIPPLLWGGVAALQGSPRPLPFLPR